MECLGLRLDSVLARIVHSYSKTFGDWEQCSDSTFHKRGRNSREEALFCAASCGHLHTCTLLLHNGMHLEWRDSQGDTALFRACSGGHDEVVKALLNHRANIQAIDMKGETPLHRCVRLSRVSLALLLLANKADVDSKDSQGKTPLFCVFELLEAQGRHFLPAVQLAQALIQGRANINQLFPDYSNPLDYAAKLGLETTVQLLLGLNADVNIIEQAFGTTPLIRAVTSGHDDVARILLEFKADVNKRNNGGYSPLHKLCQKDINQLSRFHDVLLQVLESKADINFQSTDGFSPLSMAAKVLTAFYLR